MPPRRLNDRQVERFLASLHDLSYRQELAARLAGTTKKSSTAYKSQMRRLQLYVTTAKVKRSFARSPAPIRQVTRKAARYIPIPEAVKIKYSPRPLPPPSTTSRPFFLTHVDPSPLKPKARAPRARDITELDIRALIAYHDADVDEIAETLSLSNRAESLLDLVTTTTIAGQEFEVLGARGSGELIDSVRDFFDESLDIDDLEDFVDLFGNLPTWQQGVIFEDMQEGRTTFADWLDAWRNDSKVFRFHGDPDDEDLSDSAYWELWRAAYARAKA